MAPRVILAGYNVDADQLGYHIQDCPQDLTPETISAAYARISRSPDPVDVLRQKAAKDVKKARKSNETIVFDYGHQTVAEHAVFNFDIIDVSRLAIEAIEHSRLCVTGDAVLVSATSSGAARRRTVGQLYDAWSTPGKHSVRRIQLRSVDSAGCVVGRRVLDVVCVGERDVYEVKTRCGRSLKATADELLLTSTGYRQLSTLEVGDRVVANGMPAYKNEEWLRFHYLQKNMERKDVAALAGVSDVCIGQWVRRFGLQKPKSQYPNRHGGGGKPGMHSSEGLARIAAARTGVNNESWKGVDATKGAGYRRAQRRFSLESCDCCGTTEKLERHHLDGNPLNNDENNVIVVCSCCHKAHHHLYAVTAVYTTPVTSVRYVGRDIVYAVKMDGCEKNFVVNGLVIHNCSFTEKSQRYITFDPEKDEFVVPEEIESAGYGPLFRDFIKETHEQYHTLLDRIRGQERPQGGSAEEDARYVSTLAVTGQLGMTVNARSLGAMIRRLRSNPLQEVQKIGEELRLCAREVTPSLIRYSDPEPLRQHMLGRVREAIHLRLKQDHMQPVQLLAAPGQEGQGDLLILAALVHQAGIAPYSACHAVVSGMSGLAREALLKELLQDLEPWAAMPRQWEFPVVAFEVVCSASCFAQLKRHRMATVLPQAYDPALGVTIPDSIQGAATETLERFHAVMRATEALYRKLSRKCSPAVAEYALTQAHRRRVLVQMNVRELYHFSRLREDGHAQWEIRQLAREMVSQVRELMPLTMMFACGKDRFDTLQKHFLGENNLKKHV